MKIKISPLFILLGIYLCLINKGLLFIGYLFSILIHEYTHMKVAKLRGYNFNNIKIMPFGGVCKGTSFLNKYDGLIIMLSGPLVNFIFSLFIVALWWLFPDIYGLTMDICYASISLGVINLLPLYPLDGSQIILSLSKNKILTMKILKIITYVVGIAFIVLMFISIKYKFNLTLGVFGVFLILSTIFNTENSLLDHVLINSYSNKNYEYGVKLAVYKVSKKTCLYNLVSKISSQEISEFIVLDENLNEITRINEARLYEILKENSILSLIGDVI